MTQSEEIEMAKRKAGKDIETDIGTVGAIIVFIIVASLFQYQG